MDLDGLLLAAVGPVNVLRANPALKFCFDYSDVGESAVIGLARRLRAHVSGGDNVKLMAQMIESQQPVVEGENAIWKPYIILRTIRQPLELTNHVIGEIPHATGSKRRQVRQDSGTMLPQVLSQQVHDAALAATHRRALAECQIFSPRGDHGPWLSAQEGIAPNLLAALNRFQQEGILLPGSDTEKCSHRSQQVGAQSSCHRYERGLTAELQEAFEVGRKHRIVKHRCEVYWDYTAGAAIAPSRGSESYFPRSL